ncbi:MAG: ABC transporter substrate-binding protein [Clostridia bacterium]|nr:ABC transporter substrate-binding protein [Clostridia bacterium]
MKKILKVLAALMLAVCIPFVCTAENAAESKTPLRVAGLKGPTGMALAHMITVDEGNYELTLVAAPAEVNALVISGQVDIAAVPINAGAVLYNKTEGGVRALSLITRGMLYVLENGDSIHSVDDLAGKTMLNAGQGATPEYVMNYILDTAGVKAEMEFLPEHSAVASLAIEGKADVVLLPEPLVTQVLMKNPSFRKALDVTEEFAAAAQKNGYADAQLSMSVVIVRKEYLEKNPEKTAQFMKDLEASIAFANENVSEAAQEIAALEIIPSAAIAEKALPSCSLVFVSGEAMQAQAAPLYDILFAANPAAVGGKTPDDAYYGSVNAD